MLKTYLIVLFLLFKYSNQFQLFEQNQNLPGNYSCGTLCSKCTIEQACQESPQDCKWFPENLTCISKNEDNICETNCAECNYRNQCNTSPQNCLWSNHNDRCMPLCNSQNCGECVTEYSCYYSGYTCSWIDNSCIKSGTCQSDCSKCSNQAACQDSLKECGFIDEQCIDYCESEEFCSECTNQLNCKKSSTCTWVQDQCMKKTVLNTCDLLETQYDCSNRNDCYWDSYYKKCYIGSCDSICSICDNQEQCSNSQAYCTWQHGEIEYDGACQFGNCNDGFCNLCESVEQCDNSSYCRYDENNKKCLDDQCSNFCNACDKNSCQDRSECFWVDQTDECQDRKCGTPCNLCENKDSCEDIKHCIYTDSKCQLIQNCFEQKDKCASIKELGLHCIYNQTLEHCFDYSCIDSTQYTQYMTNCTGCSIDECAYLKNNVQQYGFDEQCHWNDGTCENSWQ